MKLRDFIFELKTVCDFDMPVMGLAVDLCLPIYQVCPQHDCLILSMLYRSPWKNAASRTRRCLRSLEVYAKNKDLLPDAEDSKIYLTLDLYNFDYSTTVKYYEMAGFEYKNDCFVAVAKAESLELRRDYPADPYLLKMQKEEPDNSFYFPFRPSIDGV